MSEFTESRDTETCYGCGESAPCEKDYGHGDDGKSFTYIAPKGWGYYEVEGIDEEVSLCAVCARNHLGEDGDTTEFSDGEEHSEVPEYSHLSFKVSGDYLMPPDVRKKAEDDAFIYGNGYVERLADGTWRRIDPTSLVVVSARWNKAEEKPSVSPSARLLKAFEKIRKV